MCKKYNSLRDVDRRDLCGFVYHRFGWSPLKIVDDNKLLICKDSRYSNRLTKVKLININFCNGLLIFN